MGNLGLLLVGGAFAGAAVLTVVGLVAKLKLKAMWPEIIVAVSAWGEKEVLKNVDLVGMVKQLDVETEINNLLDDRFHEMLDALKVAFPMVSMFLNEGVEILLKRQAKEQLAKILPELKDRMAQKVTEKVDLKDLSDEKLKELTFDRVWTAGRPALKRVLLPLYSVSVLVGTLVGAIEYLLL